MEKRQTLVLVTFDGDGKPFLVLTTDDNKRGYDNFDFDWSEAEQRLYYHNSGSGPLLNKEGRLWNPGDVSLWVAPEFLECIDLNADQVLLTDLPPGQGTFEEMTEDASEGKTVWCHVCQSSLGDDDNAPCDHLIWDDERCEHLGTGNPSAEGVDYKASLIAVFEKIDIAGPLKRAIEQGKYDIHLWGSMLGPLSVFCWLDGNNYSEAFNDLEEEDAAPLVIGVTWLLTLAAGKTVEAEEKTLEIIQEYLQASQVPAQTVG